MRRTLFGIILFILIIILGSPAAQAANPTINVLTVKGTINPILVDYIKRGITEAEKNKAEALIIQVDTPGGLDVSMRGIVQSILNANVPVVVYVSPSGARAASAGAYITLSAHIAAMAPNTVIGAATPVQLGEGGEASTSEEMKRKIINDAAAYMKDIASSKGRNTEWAEKAVRDGISATSQEALKLGVVDLIAPDLISLVNEIDGRQITFLDGRVITLRTRGAAIAHINMSVAEDFLFTIADPNIAYILLSLAMLGIITEVLNPGLIFPGVIGGISLLLAFYSLGVLPVNYAGILLIVLAFALFIAELFSPGIGLLAAGGVVSLIIGSLILFKGGSPMFRVDPWLIAVVTLIIAGAFVFVINRVIQVHHKQVSVGKEELIGKAALVKAALDPIGTVFLEGESWNAVSNKGRVEPGEEVIVTKVEGLKLFVTKK